MLVPSKSALRVMEHVEILISTIMMGALNHYFPKFFLE